MPFFPKTAIWVTTLTLPLLPLLPLHPLHAQTPTDRGTFQEVGLFTGYSLNYGSQNGYSHLLEIGIWRSKYTRHIEPVTANYYVATDLVVHRSKLATGYRIGGFAGFWMFCLGADLAYYTDFKKGTFRLIPYFGIGGHNLKLTINPFIKLDHREFEYLNPVSLSCSVQIKSLRKRKVA